MSRPVIRELDAPTSPPDADEQALDRALGAAQRAAPGLAGDGGWALPVRAPGAPGPELGH